MTLVSFYLMGLHITKYKGRYRKGIRERKQEPSMTMGECIVHSKHIVRDKGKDMQVHKMDHFDKYLGMSLRV